MTSTGRKQKVYVMQHELGPVKIGIAKDPEGRLSDLQVSCPYEIHIKKTKGVQNAHEVEQYLHSHFRKYHMRGEWFDIPKRDRGFEIPERIKLNGEPNTDLPLSENRDMEYEWAYVLDRFYLAMKDTKTVPGTIETIRNNWKAIRDDREPDDEDDLEKPLEWVEAKEDIPNGMRRCSNCGHTFDISDGTCPTCGSGDAADRGF